MIRFIECKYEPSNDPQPNGKKDEHYSCELR